MVERAKAAGGETDRERVVSVVERNHHITAAPALAIPEPDLPVRQRDLQTPRTDASLSFRHTIALSVRGSRPRM
eukprot:857284-Rhodomonas_salina.1